MPEEMDTYYAQVADRATRAAAMKKALVDHFRVDDGGFIAGRTKAEVDKRNAVLESAIANSAYTMTRNGNMIAAIHARVLQGYENCMAVCPMTICLPAHIRRLKTQFFSVKVTR